MNQRIMIAIAIACQPKLLIADEPTTALDVTVQAQIINLLTHLQQQQNMALIMITHDLALIAQIAHRIMVMYAGQIIESNTATQLFKQPQHPYTAALLQAMPEYSQQSRLQLLEGTVPGQYDRPAGCLFAPRCQYTQPRCQVQRPQLRKQTSTSQVSCFYPIS
jgi:dipeptide transport system ATP-binding protein